MWSLLDADGGRSRWVGASAVTWDGPPAGPALRAVVRIDGQRVHTWDGLLALDGGSLLVRLVKAEAAPTRLEGELAIGRFGAGWHDWRVDGDGTAADHFRLVAGDDVSVRVDRHRLRLDVPCTPQRWTGFAVAAADPAREGSTDAPQRPLHRVGGTHAVDELVELMDAAERSERTAMSSVRLPHHHRARATDALRVLRVLTDPATGAPVASSTTSLPEAPGEDRQFDYRFSWLRDSGLAVATAALLGQSDSAAKYLSFVGDLLDRYSEHLTPLTTTTGEQVPMEREVPSVAGWAESRPIRIGNEASGQRQLDSVAVVIEAVSVHVQCGGRMDRGTWSVVARLADLLADAPFEPTAGIWEFREPAYLSSEELARWFGLDRAVKLARWYRPWLRRSARVTAWVRGRDLARARVEAAIDPATGLLPQRLQPSPLSPGAVVVTDAAALIAALTGFFPADDERAVRLVRGTIASLEQGPFLYRYLPFDDGFRGREGAFVPASWWAVGALAAIGDVEEAERRADAMCAVLAPLQPEEWDVEAGEGLGNMPLLWSHMEAARALYLLQAARIRKRYGRIGLGLWRLSRFARLRLSRTSRSAAP